MENLADKDPYYFFPECSNSDLSWLRSFFEPEEVRHDKEKAYRFGTLLDCMITEPGKVNYFRMSIGTYLYTVQEFRLAEEMKRSFWRDEYCKLLAGNSNFQKITRFQDFIITWDGVTFALPFRIKWDLHAWDSIAQGGDIKSTTATTEREFIAACHYFNYFRQRAVYMDVEQQDRQSRGLANWQVNSDMLIGVSKVNKRVFKVPITRGDDYYREGLADYSRLGFQYATLFGNINAA